MARYLRGASCRGPWTPGASAATSEPTVRASFLVRSPGAEATRAGLPLWKQRSLVVGSGLWQAGGAHSEGPLGSGDGGHRRARQEGCLPPPGGGWAGAREAVPAPFRCTWLQRLRQEGGEPSLTWWGAEAERSGDPAAASPGRQEDTVDPCPLPLHSPTCWSPQEAEATAPLLQQPTLSLLVPAGSPQVPQLSRAPRAALSRALFGAG